MTTDLATAGDVRRWALASALNMSMATLRKYRGTQNRGISREGLIEILAGTRMKPTLDDYTWLTSTPDTDASLRAEAHVHLDTLLRSAQTPADLNSFPRELTHFRQYADVRRLADQWRDAVDRIANLAGAAESIAAGVEASIEDVSTLRFVDVLESRDLPRIAAWGRQAAEAANYSRIDMWAALGLEDVVDDALVRAGHLV